MESLLREAKGLLWIYSIAEIIKSESISSSSDEYNLQWKHQFQKDRLIEILIINMRRNWYDDAWLASLAEICTHELYQLLLSNHYFLGYEPYQQP